MRIPRQQLAELRVPFFRFSLREGALDDTEQSARLGTRPDWRRILAFDSAEKPCGGKGLAPSMRWNIRIYWRAAIPCRRDQRSSSAESHIKIRPESAWAHINRRWLSARARLSHNGDGWPGVGAKEKKHEVPKARGCRPCGSSYLGCAGNAGMQTLARTGCRRAERSAEDPLRNATPGYSRWFRTRRIVLASPGL